MAAVGRRIFVANTTFNCDPWGWVYHGDTVREGHPLLNGREHLFDIRLDKAKFEHEPPQVKAAPAKRATPPRATGGK